jgi:hypothetical protein
MWIAEQALRSIIAMNYKNPSWISSRVIATAAENVMV